MDFESDGVRLHYELHGREDGRPIVLVHGFASHYRLNWVGTGWQETLTGAGFRIIGLDCRGHGQSDKPHGKAAYTARLMAGDVHHLLDHIGVERTDYLGFSMGARIGLQFVLDHPERVGKAVLAGLGVKGAIDQAPEIARAFRGGTPETPIADSFYKFASGHKGNDLEALASCIEGLERDLDPARLARITTPILVVIGDRDELASGAHELGEWCPAGRLGTGRGRDDVGTVPAREFKQAALGFLD